MGCRVRWCHGGVGVALILATVLAWAGEVDNWLRQLQDAAQSHAYAGTMVISVGEQMATAQVAHAVRDGVSVDRIEVLTGEPRTTYRRGTDVVTVWPQQGLWVKEQRHDLALFPALSSEQPRSVDAWYQLRRLSDDRVAGHTAQVVELAPRDQARWAYRIWRDARTGLMLKLQSLSSDLHTVLEQTAFTSLEVPAQWPQSVWPSDLPQPQGMRSKVVRTREVKPEAWGLRLSPPVKGFVLQRAQLPAEQPAPDAQHPVQWIFSDGLASVSVFYQPQPASAPAVVGEQVIRMGATHTLQRQTPAMRLTVVGEVPMPTLQAFADALVVTKMPAPH